MLDLLAGLSSSVLQTLFLGCLLHLLPASTAQIHSLGVARRGQVPLLPSQPTQKSGNFCFPMIPRSAPAGSPDRDGVVGQEPAPGLWWQTDSEAPSAPLRPVCALEQGALRLSCEMRWARAKRQAQGSVQTGFGLQELLLRPSPAQDST